MNTFLIIIALVLWVGLKSYKSVRQQMADPENSAEVKEPASASVTFAEEECSAGYYSYETVEDINADQNSKVDDIFSQQNNVMSVDASEMKDSGNEINFDLRQAVIYQTILSNKYLSEV